MFALFFSLYLAMFKGSWYMFQPYEIKNALINVLNSVGTFATSLFNNVGTPMSTLGTDLMTEMIITGNTFYPYQCLIAFILAIITSIGIVIMAVKGIKRVFSIFFMGVR